MGFGSWQIYELDLLIIGVVMRNRSLEARIPRN